LQECKGNKHCTKALRQTDEQKMFFNKTKEIFFFSTKLSLKFEIKVSFFGLKDNLTLNGFDSLFFFIFRFFEKMDPLFTVNVPLDLLTDDDRVDWTSTNDVSNIVVEQTPFHPKRHTYKQKRSYIGISSTI
jgi:hypothetical protein